MRTLPDLFDALAEHGEHAGADTVVARALANAHADSPVVTLRADDRPPRRRRPVALLVAAAVTIALVTVPLALRGTNHTPRPSRQPSGPPYPAPAPGTASELAAMHWSKVAQAPIPLVGANQVVAWAGNEVVVYGVDARHSDPHGAGAAYDPATGRWRVLPRAPLKGDWFFAPSWTWTGRELIVFPTTTPDTREPVGEAYSPGTNSWRVLAPAPLCTVARAGITWTGSAVVVAGGYDISGSQCADARVARSAFYDPRTDHWTLGPRLPVRAGDRLEVTRLVWAGGRVVAVTASQRGGSGSSSTPARTTPGSSPTSTGAARSLTLTAKAKDPIVRAYSLRPGDRAWRALGDLTNATSGETGQDRWEPSAVGTRVVFPPSVRFCAEGGNDLPCGIAGVQNGTVYDIDPGTRSPLVVPKLSYPNDVDATAFTGGALYASLYAPSAARTFAWDITTGRRLTLPNPPDRPITAVWTGNELIAVALPATTGNGNAVLLRLGP